MKVNEERAGIACSLSESPLLPTKHAICPGCGHVVAVRVVDGLWTFSPHDEVGYPLMVAKP